MNSFKSVAGNVVSVIGMPFRFISWLVYIGDLQKETFYYCE